MKERTVMNRKIAAIAAATIGVLVLTGTGGAVAGSLITSKDIKDGSIKVRDLGPGVQKGLKSTQGPKGNQGNQGPAGPAGSKGDVGPKGDQGVSGLTGAVYRVADYGTGGGRASVACADTEAESQKYTAIAGGVQSDDSTGTTTATQPVTSSFPGRMDWSTNQPKPNRLDGWIVNFGSGGQPVDVLRVWALCVPNTGITVQVTEY